MQSNGATLSKKDFFKHKFKKLPAVDLDYYQKNKFVFDPDQKLQEFYDIELCIKHESGKYNNVVSTLIQPRYREYRDVTQLTILSLMLLLALIQLNYVRI